MDQMYRRNWRGMALPFILTAVVIGSAVGFAFS